MYVGMMSAAMPSTESELSVVTGERVNTTGLTVWRLRSTCT